MKLKEFALRLHLIEFYYPYSFICIARTHVIESEKKPNYLYHLKRIKDLTFYEPRKIVSSSSIVHK